MSRQKANPLQRFLRWLFGSPFKDLPPEFGDPVPSDLRRFEAKMEDVATKERGAGPLASADPHSPIEAVERIPRRPVRSVAPVRPDHREDRRHREG